MPITSVPGGGVKLTSPGATGALRCACWNWIVTTSPSFTCGVRVGFGGAYRNNGTPAILTGAGSGGGPQVSPFNGATFADLTNFFAFAPSFSGGIFIAG